MPERKQLARISYVTDHDTGLYHIGEVDGAFQEDQLKEFIASYGRDELLSTLAYMTHQVISAAREVNREREPAGGVKENSRFNGRDGNGYQPLKNSPTGEQA